MGWFGPIFLYIVLALAVVGVISIIKSLAGGKSESPAEEESAMDILRRRYARGEISREEFEEMKSSISK